MSRSAQVRALARGVDIVVATPGRLTDLMDDRSIVLDQTRFVVLDEADRMLDMGFIQPVRKIVASLHPRRQSALFSATMPAEVAGLAAGLPQGPGPRRGRAAGDDRRADRPAGRAASTTAPSARGSPRWSRRPGVGRAIVFARTKHGADRVAQNLVKDGVAAEVIHGNKAQNARQRALNAFRNGQVRVLVATDIVARGIDVPGVTHVVNYDLPDEPEAYVHRIGRTGRNGADGIAVTLCAPDEMKKLRAVEKLTRQVLLAGGRDLAGPGGREAPAPSRRAASKHSPKHAAKSAGGRPATTPRPRRPRPQPTCAPHPDRLTPS